MINNGFNSIILDKTPDSWYEETEIVIKKPWAIGTILCRKYAWKDGLFTEINIV